MSLITDALRKADSSLSTPPQAHSPTQDSPAKPQAEPPPPPPPAPQQIHWSHGAFFIGCIAVAYLLFAYRPATSIRSQKIAVMRIPRSVTRPHPADSYETAGIPRPTQATPFSTALSPQTTSRFQSTKLPATAQSVPVADNKIGGELLRAMASQWRLNGIIRGGAGRPLALVNNELVQEGDSFHGARVAQIRDDQVLLEADGQMQILRLE